MSKKFLKASIALAATASVLVLAGCPTTPPAVVKTTPPPVVTTPPPVVTTTPPVVTTTPPVVTTTPPVVTTTPPVVTGTPGPVVPTPGTSAIPTGVIQQGNTSVRIYVVDDNQNAVSDADVTAVLTVTGAGTFANGTDTTTIKTANGNAIFNVVPQGVLVKYTVSKAGYTTRELTYSAVTGGLGTSILNDLAFGDVPGLTNFYGGANYAVSDKPEVIAIDPAYNSSGVAPSVAFKLTFSENVDKASVEDNFVIATNEHIISDYTVGARFLTNVAAVADDDLGLNIANSRRQLVYDKSSFDLGWDGEKVVTFSPKSGFALPTDKESSRLPQFVATFRSTFKDKGGISSRTPVFPAATADGPFRVTTTFKPSSPFTILTDTTAPKVDSVSVSDATTIKMRFTETMALYPYSSILRSTAINTSTLIGVVVGPPATLTITGLQGSAAADTMLNLYVEATAAATKNPIWRKITTNTLANPSVITVASVAGMTAGDVTNIRQVMDASMRHINLFGASSYTYTAGNFSAATVYVPTYKIDVDNDGDGTYETAGPAVTATIMDSTDTANKTIKLTCGSIAPFSSKRIRISVDSTKELSDPAGNSMSSTMSERSATVVVPNL